MADLIRIGIPITAFVLMLVVGLDCSAQGFRRGLARPGVLAAITLAQFTCIPAVMIGISLLLALPPATCAALLLIGACPSGTISNTYTFVAKGSTPLSVLFTVLSSLAALVLTPLAIGIWGRVLSETVGAQLTLPLPELLRQVLITLAIPVGVGCLLRLRFPDFAERYLKHARVLSLLLLLTLLTLIVAGKITTRMAVTEEATWAPPLGAPAQPPSLDDRKAFLKKTGLKEAGFSKFTTDGKWNVDDVLEPIYKEASEVIGREFKYPAGGDVK